ncbi:simple sugar transport system permease protein/D-ribose pyranase [Streptosporangium becharense]|uniref:D-ribose pyranase n=1 Tax=Streptosporangium becharense TaxID=1816182 RepID=A0A7W9IBY1_9ACTN|nr:D-ribose pyranase [Streptosporangium becharense]MBB2910736.1 simple sugar transport system permease protein/D-ribose pyranase [Streptosporangium becharense]MBB5817431.1 simple sugar transport system permease protein/D-ribose pyranase [Streptosporangium becharense]
MKRQGILNARLAGALSSLGHGDLLLVVDVGFPIPRDAERIDLAVAPDLPDLRTVIDLIANEIIVERVVRAGDVPEFNAPLEAWLRERFGDAEFEERPHTDMLGAVAREAKAVVRTGAYEPWGNVGLVSGVDVTRFFAKDGVVVPDYYRARVEAQGA